VLTYIVLETRTFPFWENYTLYIPWYSLPGTVAKKTRYSRITWDPNVTSIRSARLHGRIWAGAGSTGQIYFNDELTHWCDARFADASIDAEVDVTGLLRNGENGVSIELTKFAGLDKAGIFSAELIIEYEGQPPGVTPPEERRPWWEIPLYIGLGIGGIIAVAYLIQAVRGR